MGRDFQLGGLWCANKQRGWRLTSCSLRGNEIRSSWATWGHCKADLPIYSADDDRVLDHGLDFEGWVSCHAHFLLLVVLPALWSKNVNIKASQWYPYNLSNAYTQNLAVLILLTLQQCLCLYQSLCFPLIFTNNAGNLFICDCWDVIGSFFSGK